MHFSPVHVFVFDSQQDHFDSLCLEYMAIIQSFSASCVGASYQILLYSALTLLEIFFWDGTSISVSSSL